MPEGTDFPLDAPPRQPDPKANDSVKPPPDTLSLEAIHAAIKSRHDAARSNLIGLRAEREKLARRIKTAVAEEAEARRLANALKPKTPRKQKAAK